MDKSLFLNRLIDTLREECLHAVHASKDAADYATNEESRAESQWDTQGLEASYLAAGQAGQARQWAEAVGTIQSEWVDLLKPRMVISRGALFSCDFGAGPEWYFLASVAGGQVVQTKQGEVTVITTRSPLAARLTQLKAGDGFQLANGNTGVVLQVE